MANPLKMRTTEVSSYLYIITFVIINFKFYFKFYFEIIFYILQMIQDKIL